MHKLASSPEESQQNIGAITSPSELATLAETGGFAVQCEVARNPNTPGATLEMLSRTSYPLIDRALAKNPNTPISALLYLAHKESPTDPAPILRNTILENASIAFLESVAIHGSAMLKKAVLSLPNLPPKVLEIFGQDPAKWVKTLVLGHPNTPKEVKDHLMLGVFLRQVNLGRAANPGTTPDILLAITDIRLEDKELEEHLVRNPSTPAAALDKLSRSASGDIRYLLTMIRGTELSQPTLMILSKDPVGLIRERAEALLIVGKAGSASAPLTKQQMLEKGYKGKESFDHLAISLDKKVPGYILNASGTKWVRYIYAQDPANEFPKALFDRFNLHHIEAPKEGKVLGWVGGTFDKRDSTLYVTELQSDLLQRTYELRDPKLKEFAQYKSKLENRFDGWPYVFFNQALREAREKGAAQVAVPTAAYYASEVPGAKGIAPIYEKILASYPHETEGNWNFITMNPQTRIAHRFRVGDPMKKQAQQRNSFTPEEVAAWVHHTEIFIKNQMSQSSFHSPTESLGAFDEMREQSKAHLGMDDATLKKFWDTVAAKLAEKGVLPSDRDLQLATGEESAPESSPTVNVPEGESSLSDFEKLTSNLDVLTPDYVLDLYQKAKQIKSPAKRKKALEQVQQLSKKLARKLAALSAARSRKS